MANTTIEDRKEEIRSLIFQKIGYATMCWNPIPEGVFDATECEKTANEIMELAKEWASLQTPLNDSMYMKGGNSDAEKAAFKLGFESALQTPSNAIGVPIIKVGATEYYQKNKMDEYLASINTTHITSTYKPELIFDESTPIPILTPCVWVKSDDVLAPDCVVVLACVDDEDEPIMAYLSHEVGKWYGVHTPSKYIETPSHWMPLPNKPEPI